MVAASSSGVFCAGILVYGFALLLGPISREFGWSRQSVSTRRLTGWLVDRFRGTTVSSVLLLTATAGIALIGFGLGGELDITPFLLTRSFGRRAVSTLYGVAWTTMGLAGAIGPFLMGTAFDRTGSYDGLLAWLAIGTLTAAALMLTLPVHTLRTSKQPVSAALR